ncbi:MAG TPA: hypothetical protein VKB08_18620 [Bradyrhizobium sp.]|nr:hypothetical protein [Bradyrhizobium sp.]
MTKSAIMLERNCFGGPHMGWIRICTNISAAIAAIMLSSSVQLYAAQVLITDDEAKLPSPKGAIAVDNRGITRGPRIELVSGTLPIHSPTHLLVKFTSYGGAKIDADSVKVTYLKSPTVDLTPRLKPFLQPTGIDMPDAELPAGDHTVRVDLRDSDGRAASTMFVLKVVR